MEKELTPQQSLELIKETISQARSSFMRISPFFLVWGIVFVIAGLVEFYLKTSGNQFFWTSWPIAGVIGGVLTGVVGYRQSKAQAGNSTFIDRVMSLLWGTYTFSLFVLLYMTVSSQVDPNPYVMLITAIPTFITGTIIRFPIMNYGAFAFWIGAVLALNIDTMYSGLIFSCALVVGYLLPGFTLSKKENAIQSA